MNYCAALPSALRPARIRQDDLLRKYLGRARRLIGIELVDVTDVSAGIETHNTDLAHLPLADGVVNIIISRSVFEHLADPQAVYAEFSRVLRPGGVVIFLTANLWDDGTLIARLVPNRFHARIVAKVEGRAAENTFLNEYRTTTRRDFCAAGFLSRYASRERSSWIARIASRHAVPARSSPWAGK